MIKIQLCYLITCHHFIFIESQVEKFDFEWDKELMKNDADLMCGIQDKYPEEKSARILNGALVNDHKYPWKADILNVIFNSDETYKTSSSCSGSVISEKVILTAAHCLCMTSYELDENGNPPVQICREVIWITSSNKLQLRNQNHLYNQIHYSIGPMSSINWSFLKKYPAANFEKSIKAFLYEYEPKWWEEGTKEEKLKKRLEYKNGDIGVVIDESGLKLKARKAIPVCLPVPNTFENKFEVTAAGSGKIYQQYKDNNGKIITSCMTNEGLVRKTDPQYSKTQSVFLQCKNYDRKKKNSCISSSDRTCTHDEFDSCMYNNVANLMKENTAGKCTVPWVRSNENICTNHMDVNTTFWIGWNRITNQKKDCLSPCHTTITNFGAKNFQRLENEKYGYMYLYFLSRVVVSEEKYLYSFLKLIAQIGGYLGWYRLFVWILFDICKLKYLVSNKGSKASKPGEEAASLASLGAVALDGL